MLLLPKSSNLRDKLHYVCLKCSQVVSIAEDSLIKPKDLLEIVRDEQAFSINVVDDEPPDVRITKRMKYGRREEKSRDPVMIKYI